MQARDVIASMPVRGKVERYWRQRLAIGRLAVLNRHLSNRRSAGENLSEPVNALFDRFFALPEPVRLKIAAFPEFGAWIAEIRDSLEREGRAGKEDAETLFSRIAPFLILPILEGNLGDFATFAVSAVEGGIIALPGTPLFFKLDGGAREAKCLVRSGTLTLESECAPAAQFGIEQIWDVLAGKGISPYALFDLPPGIYRLPELRLPGMYLGLPVNRMLNASRARASWAMSAGSEPGALIRFAADGSKFVDEVNTALSAIGTVWPEMGEALPLHARFVAPIASDHVFSFSELDAPNAIFIRAAARNPLWHMELLIHETCHIWLSSLIELIPIIDSGQEIRFVSPWRPDARPLVGILFGAHAFAMVAMYFLRLLEYGTPYADVVARRVAFESERLTRGYELLRQHGRFSNAGEIFMDDLGEIVEEVRSGASSLSLGRYAHAVLEGVSLEPFWPTVT